MSEHAQVQDLSMVNKILETSNIAESMEEDRLDEIGKETIDLYKNDLESRSD